MGGEGGRGPAFPDVEGYCPMGCGETLFLAEGGHVTCRRIQCSNPTAVDDILAERETGHVVDIGEKTFDVQHPLRERIDGELFECGLHEWLRGLAGPPRRPGRYRARLTGDVARPWSFEEITGGAA